MVEGLMDEYNLNMKREMDRGERIVVGVNRFIPKDEPVPQRFSFSQAHIETHMRRFTELKQQRDQRLLGERINTLYRVVQQGRDNFHQAMIDALIADGSMGEVWGTVRVATGLTYDPFRAIESPFTYSAA